MLNLPKSSGANDTETTLNVSTTTRCFTVNGPYWLFSINGTWDGNTVSLMVSSNGLPNGTFRAYAVLDATGTLGDQTFTDDIHHGYLCGGDCFRFDANAVGTPDLDIKLSGNITIHPRS